LIADDLAVLCGGSQLHAAKSGEAREAESDDESFVHFQFPVLSCNFDSRFVGSRHQFAGAPLSSRLLANGTPVHRSARNLDVRT
jgi:hypothetical protein